MHAHHGISRRHVLGMAVGSVAMAGGIRSVWSQEAKRIEQLAPELDKIIALSEPIQTLAEDFLPFVNPNVSHFFTPSARPAHNESGLHHSMYDDATWPSGYAGVGRQYCVRPGHAAVPSPATPHTRC